MSDTFIICEGYRTCQHKCAAKTLLPFDEAMKTDAPIYTDRGSCYHKDHSDNEYHECSHINLTPTKDFLAIEAEYKKLKAIVEAEKSEENIDEALEDLALVLEVNTIEPDPEHASVVRKRFWDMI